MTAIIETTSSLKNDLKIAQKKYRAADLAFAKASEICTRFAESLDWDSDYDAAETADEEVRTATRYDALSIEHSQARRKLFAAGRAYAKAVSPQNSASIDVVFIEGRVMPRIVERVTALCLAMN